MSEIDPQSMRRGFFAHIVVGALIVMVVIAAASVWTLDSANSAVGATTERVSGFYLQELAGHRSQVISGQIEEVFDELRHVRDLVRPEDLESQESLRAYIGEVENLLGFDLFAFADEQHTVYSRYATYSGGSRYAFLTDGQIPEEGTSSQTTMYGASRQVCLALPCEGMELAGHPLEACFVQIDIDRIVSNLAYESEQTNTTFCLYHSNGESLSKSGSDPFGSHSNLLEEMGRHLDAAQMERLEEDFASRQVGGFDLHVDGNLLSLYYAPVKRTDWMLAVFVSDNVIKQQMKGVTEDVLSRSAVQVVVSAVALTLYFASIIWRVQNTSAAMVQVERMNSREAGRRAERSEQALHEVKDIAYRDALTGVGSKHAFSEREQAIDDRIRRGEGVEIAVIVCDVNGLKQVNDTLGHVAGDELLEAAASLLKEGFAEGDIYRYGGDEFCVIMEADALAHVDEDLAAFDARVERNLAAGDVVVASGLARLEEGDERLGTCFERADQLMYARKEELKRMGASTRS